MYWLKRMPAIYDPSNPRKYLNHILIQNDRIFILAHTQTPGWIRWNPLVYALDTSGTVLWYKYEGGWYSLNYPKTILLDQNNLYLIAETKDSTQLQQSVSCVKYNKDSSRIWRTDINFSATSSDSPLEAFIDDSSNIYISCVTTDSASKGIFYIAKLDSSGNIKWVTNGKYATQIKRINIPQTGGNNPNKQTTAHAKAVLDSEADFLTIWKDSLNSPTELDKTLYCGQHLWNRVSDSSYAPLSIKKGNEGYYYAVFQSGRSLITAKYKDTTGGKTSTSLSITNSTSRSISLGWTNPKQASSVKIERSTDGQQFAIIDSISDGTNHYTDTFLVPKTTYYYRIYSYDFFGGRCPLGPDSATTLNNVGIKPAMRAEIQLYPNPVTSVLHIANEELTEFEYRIIDLNGKTILKGQNTKLINCFQLKPGLYFLELETPQQNYIPHKIVKL